MAPQHTLRSENKVASLVLAQLIILGTERHACILINHRASLIPTTQWVAKCVQSERIQAALCQTLTEVWLRLLITGKKGTFHITSCHVLFAHQVYRCRFWHFSPAKGPNYEVHLLFFLSGTINVPASFLFGEGGQGPFPVIPMAAF